jgi:hypothetical protein
MTRQIRDVTDQVICDEAQALAILLSGPDRCCMVHVTVAYNDVEGTVRHGHGVTGNTKGAHLRQFILATERQLQWLRDKLFRRA